MMVKLALRSLAAHRLRLVFIVIAVVLAISFVSGSMIFRDTATRAFDSLFDDLSQDEIVAIEREDTFTSDAAPPQQIPASVLTDLEQNVPEASSLYGQVEGYAAVILPDGLPVGGEGVAQRGRAYVERPGSEMRIVTGRAPEAAGEVVVEEHTAAEGGIQIGDTITVLTEYTTETVEVVGVFTLGEQWTGDLVTYVAFAPEVAENILTEPGHYTAIWAQPAAGVTLAELTDAVAAALPAGYEVKTGEQQVQEVQDQLESLFDLLARLLLGFAGISVLVGAFIIFNTFTMLMAQRTRELALLRAVGASRAQVTRAVLGEAVAIGFIGSTLGLLAGVGISLGLIALFEQFGTELPARLPVVGPSTVFWSYAVGIAVTVVVSYFPARRASRVPPVAALRDDVGLPTRSLTVRLILGSGLALIGGLILTGGLSAGGVDGAIIVAVGGILLFVAIVMLSPLLSRPVLTLLSWPIARLGGAIGRLSRENARRDRRRSAATASALMVGLALVSMATVLANSMSASAATQFDTQFAADYTLDPRGLTGFSPDVVTRVADVAGVVSVTPVQFGTIKVDGDEVSVAVADATDLTTPTSLEVVSGSESLAANELLVQRSVAEQRGWEVGTVVPGEYPDQSEAPLRVAGIFAANQVINRPYIMSPDSYQAHATGELIQRAFVVLDEPSQAARDGLDRALAAHPNVELNDRADATAGARESIDQTLNVILVLLILSIVIAAVGIVNTLGLSVVERTREIGLLRAVGVSRGQIRAMIRYESVVIALFGAALGLGLGVAVGWALQNAMASEGVEVLSISFGRLSLYLLSAIAIGAVAAIWPAWRAARMNILDAIHHQ
jgi:putative ABC transport system permease protein